MSDLDREAAREALDRFQESGATWDVVLDALEACLRPTPSQGIKQDELMVVLHHVWDHELTGQGAAHRILTLVRPVDGGVVLTREEAQLAAEELRDVAAGWVASDEHDRAGACDALAQRLEAAS